MGNGIWEMGNGKWEMGNEKWEMGNDNTIPLLILNLKRRLIVMDAGFKIEEYHLGNILHISLSFSRGILGHIMRLNQLRTSRNIIIPSWKLDWQNQNNYFRYSLNKISLGNFFPSHQFIPFFELCLWTVLKENVDIDNYRWKICFVL